MPTPQQEGAVLVNRNDEPSDMHRTLEYLLDLEELRNLKARYLRLRDLQRWEEWAELFTDDFTFESDYFPEKLQGRDAFVDGVRRGMSDKRSIHMCHTPELRLTGRDSATGTWSLEYFIEGSSKDGDRTTEHGFGFHQEEYVRCDGRWLMASLRLTSFH